jgi:hypothetical protein
LTSSPWDIRDGSTSQSGLRLLISRIFSAEPISRIFFESYEPSESPEPYDMSQESVESCSEDMPYHSWLPALLEQNEK